MADTLALLEYNFLFNPEHTWNTIDDFEVELSEFFKSKGYEADAIIPIDAHSTKRILFINKVDKLDEMREPEPQQPKGPMKAELDKFRGKETKDGK